MEAITRIIKWIDLDNPQRDIYGVFGKYQGEWYHISRECGGESKPFLGTKMEAIGVAKEFEQKLMSRNDQPECLTGTQIT